MKRAIIGHTGRSMGAALAMALGHGAALRQRYEEANAFPGNEPDILIFDEAHPLPLPEPALSRQQRRAAERQARKQLPRKS